MINERDLPEPAYRPGPDHVIRFLEYREHMLRNYLDLAEANTLPL